jgi:hypothetical protein
MGLHSPATEIQAFLYDALTWGFWNHAAITVLPGAYFILFHSRLKRLFPSCNTQLKVQVKLSVFNKVPRHEDAGGNGSVAPRIINVGAKREWVVSKRPGCFAPVPTWKKAVWTPQPVWRRW